MKTMRADMGPDVASADPRYRVLVQLLAAHLRSQQNNAFTFSQWQAFKSQVYIYTLMSRNQPVPEQYIQLLKAGLASGRRPPPEALGAEFSATSSSAAATPGATGNAMGAAPKMAPLPSSSPISITKENLHELLPDRRIVVQRQGPRADVNAPAAIDDQMMRQEQARLRRKLFENELQRRQALVRALRDQISEHERRQQACENDDAAEQSGVALARLRSDYVRVVAGARELTLFDLQRKVRSDVYGELTAGGTTNKGAVGREKQREKLNRQLVREYEKLERNRAKRIETAEREVRKRRNAWFSALTDHHQAFKSYHTGMHRACRGTGRAVVKHFDELAKSQEKAEREAQKARMQKLMHEDEEGYIEMVRNSKNKRLKELLNQTDEYLKQLGATVKKTQREAKSRRRGGGAGASGGDAGGMGDAQLHGGDGAQDDFGTTDDEDDGTHKTYYEIAHANKEKVEEQPKMMLGGKLKEYQMQGLQWMVSLYNNGMNGILADEMGLGKTVQTIALVSHLMEKKGNGGPFLIVVPLSTMSNWELEFQRWAPSIRVIVFKGDKKIRKSLFDEVILKAAFNVCLITYEYVVRGKNLLKKVEWEYIIVDEGHRMKNGESRLSTVLGDVYQSRHRLLLTGTPLQNSLEELWSLLNFILPTVFGSQESFEQWFAGPFATGSGRGGGGSGNNAADEHAQLTEEENMLVIFRLHQVLRPFLLRRLKAEVLKMGEQLPSKQEDVILCDMSAWQRYMYKKMVHNERVPFTDNNGKRRYDRLANPAMQLRKVVNHPYLFFEDYSQIVEDGPELWRASGKFDMLDACLMKLLRTGHRVLVFNQMTKVLDLQERLLAYRGFKYLRLDGSTRPEVRKKYVELFNQENSDYNLFLLTTRAGGLGVNLQTADTVIIFDSDWNPQADLQAQDRAHRIGQKRQVRILRFVTARSVEEDVIEKATYKRGLEAKIIRAGMFDEQSKDVDRQAMLRELLREEEEGSEQEDAVPTLEELNKILARSEEEEELFGQVDEERALEIEGAGPLMNRDELPEWVVNPEITGRAMEEIDEEAAAEQGILWTGGVELGKRKAATKHFNYGVDAMSDDKYIALMEGGQNVQDYVGKRGRPKGQKMGPRAKGRKGEEGEQDAEDMLASRMSTELDEDMNEPVAVPNRVGKTVSSHTMPRKRAKLTREQIEGNLESESDLKVSQALEDEDEGDEEEEQEERQTKRKASTGRASTGGREKSPTKQVGRGAVSVDKMALKTTDRNERAPRKRLRFEAAVPVATLDLEQGKEEEGDFRAEQAGAEEEEADVEMDVDTVDEEEDEESDDEDGARAEEDEYAIADELSGDEQEQFALSYEVEVEAEPEKDAPEDEDEGDEDEGDADDGVESEGGSEPGDPSEDADENGEDSGGNADDGESEDQDDEDLEVELDSDDDAEMNNVDAANAAAALAATVAGINASQKAAAVAACNADASGNIAGDKSDAENSDPDIGSSSC
ncbi:Chromatin structure-remodeling complex subunit snf21 [Porphyridium purpureum]|uniref:Chromatin structure-remodeling complex subunit snf21 n=1 Tax=Porphyridium purpureum TaxID=35688 RepID=A0A5J4YP78_PORPP|nr:Chromatin structure-remodeling complex subunit snf21 [Porphyridium purpureum]|eukprot:POR5798..scf296_7